MNDPNEGRLIDFVKDGIRKGYDEEKLKQMMKEHHVPEEEISEVIEEAEKELAEEAAAEFSKGKEPAKEPAEPKIPIEEAMPPVEKKPKEEKKEEKPAAKQKKKPIIPPAILNSLKERESLYSLLTIIIGFALMLIVYSSRLFREVPDASAMGLGLKLIKGFWPLFFPVVANTINFFVFRKHFRLYLIVSLITLLVLFAAVVLLATLG